MIAFIDWEKPVFPISIVAELLGVTPRCLRWYESEGLVIPSRTRGNTRLYSHRDIDTLRYVCHLIRSRGVNVQGVKVILEIRRYHNIESLEPESSDDGD